MPGEAAVPWAVFFFRGLAGRVLQFFLFICCLFLLVLIGLEFSFSKFFFFFEGRGANHDSSKRYEHPIYKRERCAAALLRAG